MNSKFNNGDIVHVSWTTNEFNEETIKRFIIYIKDNKVYSYICWNSYNCLTLSNVTNYETDESIYTDIFRELKNNY